ncbi:MAG: SH3 domain-containing protein [Verrucomicrobiota bacterium]
MKNSHHTSFILPFFILVMLSGAGTILTTPLTIGNEEAESEQAREGAVTAGTLNIRARAGRNYETVGKLRQGDKVEILEEEDDWLGIKAPSDIQAWCAAEYLGADGENQADRLRVRAGPGIVFSPITKVSEGEKVELTDETSNGWQRIKPPEHTIVWVHSDYVDVAEPEGDREKDEAMAGLEGLDEEERALVSTPLETDKLVKPDLEQLKELAEEKREARKAAAESEEEEVQTIPTTGVLIPLPESEDIRATHALAEVKDNTAHPQVLLYSDKIDFSPWHYRKVEVYGEETSEKERNRPVLFVTGIKLLLR